MMMKMMQEAEREGAIHREKSVALSLAFSRVWPAHSSHDALHCSTCSAWECLLPCSPCLVPCSLPACLPGAVLPPLPCDPAAASTDHLRSLPHWLSRSRSCPQSALPSFSPRPLPISKSHAAVSPVGTSSQKWHPREPQHQSPLRPRSVTSTLSHVSPCSLMPFVSSPHPVSVPAAFHMDMDLQQVQFQALQICAKEIDRACLALAISAGKLSRVVSLLTRCAIRISMSHLCSPAGWAEGSG